VLLPGSSQDAALREQHCRNEFGATSSRTRQCETNKDFAGKKERTRKPERPCASGASGLAVLQPTAAPSPHAVSTSRPRKREATHLQLTPAASAGGFGQIRRIPATNPCVANSNTLTERAAHRHCARSLCFEHRAGSNYRSPPSARSSASPSIRVPGRGQASKASRAPDRPKIGANPRWPPNEPLLGAVLGA